MSDHFGDIVLAKMRELIDASDLEIAHSDADELLMQALMLAAQGKVSPELAQSICNTWRSIDKWYA